jgi:hypothetical protein
MGFVLFAIKLSLRAREIEDNLMLLHRLLPKMANHWAKGRRNELNKTEAPSRKTGLTKKLIEVKVRP